MEARARWLYAWGLGYTAAGAASLLIPLYALSLGGGAFVVGILASTAAFAGVPGALLWGYLAARTGRRRVFVVVALLATAVILAATPLVQIVWVLVGVNALLWFVLAAAAPVLNLLVIEGTPEGQWEQRIAALNAYQGYGWLAGLILGSIWIPIGARLLGPARARIGLFWAGALAAFLAVPLAVRWLPRESTVTPEEITRSPSLLGRVMRGGGQYVRTVPFATTRLYWGLRGMDVHDIGALWRVRHRFSRGLWVYFAAVMAFTAGFAVFWGPIPAYLGASFTDGQIFWLFLAANAGSAAFYTRAGRWAASVGGRSLQTRALLARVFLFPLVGVVAVIIPAVLELPALLVVFAVIGVTWAVIAITATGIVSRLAGGELALALGFYTALAGIGGGIGSIGGGFVASRYGYPVAFVLAGVTVLIGVLVVPADELRQH